MNKYHKIQSVYKRDPATKYKTFLNEYSLPAFEALEGIEWQAYEKIDGMNIRLIFANGGFELRGKSDAAMIPPGLLKTFENWKLSEVVEKFMQYNDKDNKVLCLYGEGFGPGIQRGGHYGEDVQMCIFDAMVDDKFLSQRTVEEIAASLDLETAPLISTGSLKKLVDETATGVESTFGNFIMEGYICRPKIDLFDCFGNRMITKVKHCDFPR